METPVPDKYKAEAVSFKAAFVLAWGRKKKEESHKNKDCLEFQTFSIASLRLGDGCCHCPASDLKDTPVRFRKIKASSHNRNVLKNIEVLTVIPGSNC